MTEDFIQELEKLSSEDIEKILIEKRKKEGKRYIQLNDDDILRLEIKTPDGKPTGEMLEFDLQDIELPLKYQEIVDMNKKNKQNYANQIKMIKGRKDLKGKKLMSKNQEDLIKATSEFFKKEAEAYDIFLGKGGVNKLLHGRPLGWTSLEEIEEIVDKQIMPYLDLSMENIENKIIKKYSQATERNSNILRNE